LVVGHDDAAVRVVAQGYRRGTDLGVSIDGVPLAWSALDVLRTEGGRVAERWSRGGVLSLAAPVAAGDLADLAADPAILQVSRLILRPGARLPTLTVVGSALLVVEEGVVAVRTEKSGPVDPGLPMVAVDHVLRQRERLALSLGLYHTVRNDGPARAIVGMVAIDPVEFLPEHRPGVP
jgi:hypothetical protein